MSALTLAEASRIVRDAVKDRAYRATPLGLEVARYYRWKKNEWGATKDTMRDKESPVIYLACGKWWLVLAVIAADLVIATFIGDRIVRWELEQIRGAW